MCPLLLPSLCKKPCFSFGSFLKDMLPTVNITLAPTFFDYFSCDLPLTLTSYKYST